MEKYKLSDFGLIKHCLKRKICNVSGEDRTKLEEIFLLRTTKYDLETIEFIIKTLYSNDTGKTSPLSIYYTKFNKIKSNKLNSMIGAKKTGTSNLEKDVKNLISKSQIDVMKYEEYMDNLYDLSEIYNVSIEDIKLIVNKTENEILEKL